MKDWACYLASLRQPVSERSPLKKNPLMSKTLWLSLLATLASWFVDVQAVTGLDARTQLTALAAAYAGLRLVTNTKISLDA